MTSFVVRLKNTGIIFVDLGKILSRDSIVAHEICIKGKLLNFNWLIYPSTCDQGYVMNVDDLTLQKISNILETIHFAPKLEEEIKQLLFEYRELFEFACTTADEYRLKY